MTEEPDAVSSASQTEKKVNLGSDLDVKETYMVGANQYLGRSNAGVGNEVVVRITVDDDKKLKDIEIIEHLHILLLNQTWKGGVYLWN